MTEHDRATERHEHAEVETEHHEHKASRGGAASGAVMGTVAVGPLGAPIGAAIGAIADKLIPDADEPPQHTHDTDAACYDGCPSWHSSK